MSSTAGAGASAPLDTTPDYPPADPAGVRSAVEALSQVWRNLPRQEFPGTTAPSHGQRVARADDLAKALAADGHEPAAAAWAIHECVRAGWLIPEVRNEEVEVGGREEIDRNHILIRAKRYLGDHGRVPTVRIPGRMVPRPTFTGSGPVPFDCLLVRTTQAFWERPGEPAGWGGLPRMSTGDVEPPPSPPSAPFPTVPPDDADPDDDARHPESRVGPEQIRSRFERPNTTLATLSRWCRAVLLFLDPDDDTLLTLNTTGSGRGTARWMAEVIRPGELWRRFGAALCNLHDFAQWHQNRLGGPPVPPRPPETMSRVEAIRFVCDLRQRFDEWAATTPPADGGEHQPSEEAGRLSQASPVAESGGATPPYPNPYERLDRQRELAERLEPLARDYWAAGAELCGALSQLLAADPQDAAGFEAACLAVGSAVRSGGLSSFAADARTQRPMHLTEHQGRVSWAVLDMIDAAVCEDTQRLRQRHRQLIADTHAAPYLQAELGQAAGAFMTERYRVLSAEFAPQALQLAGEVGESFMVLSRWPFTGGADAFLTPAAQEAVRHWDDWGTSGSVGWGGGSERYGYPARSPIRMHRAGAGASAASDAQTGADKPSEALAAGHQDQIGSQSQPSGAQQTGPALHRATNGEVDGAPTSKTEGGRPKLGQGPNATEQEQALRNVYELIRPERNRGSGARALFQHFRKNADFKKRVEEAGKTCNEQLFRNAIAWLKDNSDPDAESGNAS